MNVTIEIMKYVTTIALGSLVAIMATDYTIGIYMTYALAMVCQPFFRLFIRGSCNGNNFIKLVFLIKLE